MTLSQTGVSILILWMNWHGMTQNHGPCRGCCPHFSRIPAHILPKGLKLAVSSLRAKCKPPLPQWSWLFRSSMARDANYTYYRLEKKYRVGIEKEVEAGLDVSKICKSSRPSCALYNCCPPTLWCLPLPQCEGFRHRF